MALIEAEHHPDHEARGSKKPTSSGISQNRFSRLILYFGSMVLFYHECFSILTGLERSMLHENQVLLEAEFQREYGIDLGGALDLMSWRRCSAILRGFVLIRRFGHSPCRNLEERRRLA